MPKNVMKLLKRSASHARNSFDLSHRHLLSANFGELLPVTCIETVPGDYIELHISDLLRAMPLVTSPFMRVKQHFDVWFTPYEDLWSNFEPFMVQKFEPKHGNNSGGFSFCPHVNKFRILDAINSQDQSIKDVVGKDYIPGALKLFDLLGYGRYDISGDASLHPDVNLWRIAQYNKIWYEEYRQQYYDGGLRFLDDTDFKYSVNPAVIFNFDDLPCHTLAESDVHGASSMQLSDINSNDLRLAEMFQMRYRCWKKDLYTGLMPSTQYGNVSSVPLTDFTSFSNFYLYGTVGTSETPVAQKRLVGDINGVVSAGNSESVSQPQNIAFSALDKDGNRRNILARKTGSPDIPGIGILDLRKSEAIQIWRERALTAGNRVGDNLRAHYGDDVDYNEHRSTYLGSVDAPLNISDINATAETGQSVNGVLGDVAGKGISSLDEKVFKFKAKKFGCIMVMFSLLPEAEYESTGIDRMNQLLESEDYFINEYQDLGLEAVSSQTFYSTLNNVAHVIGYAPRYYAYKQKLDKAFGEFKSGGVFSQWASPKFDVGQALGADSSALPLSTLYVNPALFNNNFAVDSIDHVICDIYFDCSAVRQMSLSGLPKF